MTAVRLLPGSGHVRPVTGAMLAGMAACPPAQPEDRAAPNTRAAEKAQEAQAVLRSTRHHLEQAGSPLGQVRAFAWLLGLRPAYASVTCSRLATGAARCGSRMAALRWLVMSRLPLSQAEHVAGLVWPPDVATAGDAADARVPGRARPE